MATRRGWESERPTTSASSATPEWTSPRVVSPRCPAPPTQPRADCPFEHLDGIVSLDGDEEVGIDDVCVNVGKERVRHVESLPIDPVDARIQFLRVGASREIGADVEEDLVQFPAFVNRVIPREAGEALLKKVEGENPRLYSSC